ncbi:MAG TPA: nuclear transport factor 2 family protein [Prolixibacteraceae bacterium]|jgi:ketosteroid isomerase-like protein
MIGAIIARQGVKSGYRALNEGNVDKFMTAWGDNCIWIYPGNISASGRFVGKEEVRKWFEHFQYQFPQKKFTLKHLGVGNIFAMGGHNVISTQWDLDLVNKDGMSISYSGATVLTIAGSKVIQGQDYLSVSDPVEYNKAWGNAK